MEGVAERVIERGAGVDVHKKSFNATIVNKHAVIAETKLPNDIHGARSLLQFLEQHQCSEIAIESTGPYWMGVYDYLTQHGIKVLLANPASMKAIVGKKTDRVDAMLLAYLHLAGLIRPSYVPDKRYRELRDLCRTRDKIVKIKTMIKNATTSQLHTFSSEITSVFSDTFGRSGMKVLRTILEEIDLGNEECHTSDGQGNKGYRATDPVGIASIRDKLRKDGLKEIKVAKVECALSRAYTPSINTGVVEFYLRLVEHLERTVKEMDETLARLICEDHRIGRQVMFLISIPGVDLVTAVSMVAEICEVSRFPSDKAMVGYVGLAPSVHQSGSKHTTGRITKRGSPHARRVYYQAAMAIIRTGQSGSPEMVEFYNRVKSRKGHKVAAVALARKLASTTYFMLSRNQEYHSYLESEKDRRKRKIRLIKSRAKKAKDRQASLAYVLDLAKKMELLEVIPEELRALCE